MSVTEKQKKELDVSTDITTALSSRDRSASQNNRFNMSMLELVEQLTTQKISAAGLPKEILRRCALFMKSRGHSYSHIAEVLELSEKTIQRYVHDMRKHESLKLGANFQKTIAADFLNNWRARYQRLLLLSYAPDLSVAEQIKALFVLHQIEKDGIEVLERLGYLNKRTGEGEMDMAYKKDLKKLSHLESFDDNLAFNEKLEKLSDKDRATVMWQVSDFQQKLADHIQQLIDAFIHRNNENARP